MDKPETAAVRQGHISVAATLSFPFPLYDPLGSGTLICNGSVFLSGGLVNSLNRGTQFAIVAVLSGCMEARAAVSSSCR